MAGKPGFASLRAEYARLWSTMTVTPARVSSADRIAAKIIENRARYEAVQRSTTVPWFVVAVIHSLESGLGFSRHLHNGDPLTKRTTHVPAGQPETGSPPFTWEFSAADALRSKKFDTNTDWSVERIAYLLEGYNGWGYRMYHPGTLSPYLWSFSNQYRSGKYVADNEWSQSAVSEQCGAMVLLKQLEKAGAVSFGAPTPRPIPAPVPPSPAPRPQPPLTRPAPVEPSPPAPTGFWAAVAAVAAFFRAIGRALSGRQ